MKSRVTYNRSKVGSSTTRLLVAVLRAPRILAALAALAVAPAARAGSSSLYVQDGLLACWDGIENAGSGVHNPSATVWKDLVAGREFTLNNVTVADDRMVFAGAQNSYGELNATDTVATFENAQNGTLEIVYASATGTGSQFMLQSSETSGHLLSIWSGDKLIASNGANHNAPVFTFTSGTATNSVSVRYSSAMPQNARSGGAQLPSPSNNYWGNGKPETTIGTRSSKDNNPFKGGIYCIRVYSRQLTDAEIDANHAIDVRRFREGNHIDDALEVSSSLAGVGVPSPSGTTTDLAAGDTVPVSCGATPWTNAAETATYVCTGWKLYDNDSNLVSSGSETSFVYTHPNPAAYSRLEWQWSPSTVQGTVTAAANGTVSPSGTAWYPGDAPVTITATPDAGNAFYRWTGTLPAGIDATSASVTFTPVAPFDMTATFSPLYYVATNGNDSAAGTVDAPFLTISNALEKADAAIAGGAETATILLKDGTYTEHLLYVTNAITITSASGNRDAVVFDSEKSGNIFTLNHAGAVLSGLTVVNGSRNILISYEGGIVTNCVVASGRLGVNGSGANIYMNSPAALVVDCVVTNGALYNGTAYATYGYGGNIYASGGRISRCILADGYAGTGGGNTSYGGGNAYIAGAVTMENCLLTGGKACNQGAAINIQNASVRVVNCTIVGNGDGNTSRAAVYVGNGSARVVNCAIYGNGGTKATEWGDANAASYYSCAFSSGAEFNGANTTVKDLTDAAFKKFAAGDYRPAAGGALCNAGTNELYTTYGAVSETDLLGNPRIKKKIIDIGCYEIASGVGLSIFVR